MANPRQLVEATLNLIRDHIKNKISSAISNMQSERSDNRVSITPFKEYYFIEIEPENLKNLPALFLIPVNIDFRKEAKQANHINAMIRVNCSIVFNDREKDLLALKGFRYQCVLHELLDDVSLINSLNDVKIVLKVVSATFSPVVTAKSVGSSQNDFRQEVLLELDVDHFEKV